MKFKYIILATDNRGQLKYVTKSYNKGKKKTYKLTDREDKALIFETKKFAEDYVKSHGVQNLLGILPVLFGLELSDIESHSQEAKNTSSEHLKTK